MLKEGDSDDENAERITLEKKRIELNHLFTFLSF